MSQLSEVIEKGRGLLGEAKPKALSRAKKLKLTKAMVARLQFTIGGKFRVDAATTRRELNMVRKLEKRGFVKAVGKRRQGLSTSAGADATGRWKSSPTWDEQYELTDKAHKALADLEKS